MQNLPLLPIPPKALKLPELYLVDVGHGSLGILKDIQNFLLDCGPKGPIIRQILLKLDIKEIAEILISHSDADHIGGLPLLIETFPIGRIRLNPDPSKEGVTWYQYVKVVKKAEALGTEVIVGLTAYRSQRLSSGEVEIEILAPSASLALTGAGGKYLGGRMLKSNTMSVVVRLIHRDCPVVLLPGDLDDFGLDLLLEQHKDIQAKILVFPHHGGFCGGGDDYAFARRLCSAVKPEMVLFSYARGKHGNPKKEIIAGLRAACPAARIMCTQLSCQCSPQIPISDFAHLNDLPALGQASNSCCGGTIRIILNGDQTAIAPDHRLHRAFVESLPQPLCLRSFSSPGSIQVLEGLDPMEVVK